MNFFDQTHLAFLKICYLLRMKRKQREIRRNRRFFTVHTTSPHNADCSECRTNMLLLRTDRQFGQEEKVVQRASYYKTYFNRFFHDDLYGRLSTDTNIILSTGSLDENEFSLPPSLQYAISFALLRNWYGYSHSLGRESVRIAVADLENCKINSNAYTKDNIALIQGVTAGLSHLLAYLKSQADDGAFSILTHFPTYVPFATACEKVAPTKIVDLLEFRGIDVPTIIKNIESSTRVILLLADFNPVGRIIPVSDLNILIDHCGRNKIYLIVDEAGAKYPDGDLYGLRVNKYLIRTESLSKKLAIPGMKLGYFIADEAIVSGFYEMASTSYGGPSSFFYLLQECDARFELFHRKGLTTLGRNELALFDTKYHFGLFFLNRLYKDYVTHIEYFHQKVRFHRNVVLQRLEEHRHTLIREIILPETGVNIFVRLNIKSDSYSFFEKLLTRYAVAVFPGICSAASEEGWVRITCTVNIESLYAGMDGLIKCLEEDVSRDNESPSEKAL